MSDTKLSKQTVKAVYRERHVRTGITWTPERIRTAKLAADSGHLMQAADLVDAILEDDRVRGITGQRSRGLLRLPLRFDPENGEPGEATPQTEALEETFWSAYPEDTLTELLDWALLLGVGLGQQIWELDEHGRLSPRLQVWHPRWLTYDHQQDVWMLETANEGRIPIEPDDPKWILLTPYGERRPWTRGVWRAAALWWLLKRYAMQDWGTFSEVHGNPLRVGTTPDTASKTDREELASDLEQLGNVTGLALPPGFDVKIVESLGRSWETFQRQIETANAGLAIAIAGQTLTSEVKGGSLAAAQVHDSIRLDLIEGDAEVLSTTLRRRGLEPWALFNWGDASLAPWPKWDTTPPEDAKQIAEEHKARAEALEAVARVLNAYSALGLNLDLERVADEFRLPLADVKAQLAALNGRHAAPLMLASGEPAPAGFLQGQAYVDRVAGRAPGMEGFQASLRALTTALDGASTYEEAQAAILTAFRGLDPDDTAGLTEALMLADLAGRRAVIQDS